MSFINKKVVLLIKKRLIHNMYTTKKNIIYLCITTCILNKENLYEIYNILSMTRESWDRFFMYLPTLEYLDINLTLFIYIYISNVWILIFQSHDISVIFYQSLDLWIPDFRLNYSLNKNTNLNFPPCCAISKVQNDQCIINYYYKWKTRRHVHLNYSWWSLDDNLL